MNILWAELLIVIACLAFVFPLLIKEMRARRKNDRSLILVAVETLAPKAYGVTIQDWIEANTGRGISFGTIYDLLDELETEGILESVEGDPSPEKGNRLRTYYSLVK